MGVLRNYGLINVGAKSSHDNLAPKLATPPDMVSEVTRGNDTSLIFGANIFARLSHKLVVIKDHTIMAPSTKMADSDLGPNLGTKIVAILEPTQYFGGKSSDGWLKYPLS